MPTTFDVFISHNSLEKEQVRHVVNRLLELHNIRAWFDEWDLTAGRKWEEEIERALDTCTTCVVALGGKGWGQYHLKEANHALERAQRQSGFIVIPMLLPGARDEDMSELGLFFHSNHRVDFRGGVNDADAFQRMASGIKGEATGPQPVNLFVIKRDAERWHKAAQSDKVSMLYRGGELREAKRVAGQYADYLDERDQGFLRASELDEQRVAQKERRRLRNIIVGLAAGLVLVAAAAGVAFWQRSEAERQRGEAVSQRSEAVRQREEAEAQKRNAVSNAEEAARQRDAARQNADERDRQRQAAEKNAAEAERQRGIAVEKAEEARRQRDAAEQRRRQAVAAMLDTSATRSFSEASAFDLRQQIESDRRLKLKAELEAVSKAAADPARDEDDSDEDGETDADDDAESDDSGDAEESDADAKKRLKKRLSLEARAKVLTEELAQYDIYISSLRGLARESRERGAGELTGADAQWASLRSAAAVAPRSRPSTPAIFSVEVLNARRGESIILHYGDLDNPRFVLIDGGTRGSFRQHIAPRLRELRERWAGGAPLKLDLVIASQTDADRVDGINELTDAMLKAGADSPPALKVEGVWFNHPLPASEQFAEYHKTRYWSRGKWRLALNLIRLQIPVNEPFDYYVSRPAEGAARVTLPGGLTVTVLNPAPKQLAGFQKEFEKDWKDKERALALPPLPQERFSGGGLQLFKGAKDNVAARDVGGSDKSPVNRASMVLLFEYGGKRFLYTGDANASQIFEGLREAGGLDAEGRARVNLLHIPHYGSDHNVTEEFFRSVVAENYIITGMGMHNNPEPETLEMILTSRQREEYTLSFAHRVGLEDSLGGELDEFFMRTSLPGSRYRRVFRPPDDRSLIINLLDPVLY